jgi:hypothetical protein
VLWLTRATLNVPMGARRGFEVTGISDRKGWRTGVMVAALADTVGDARPVRKSKVSRMGSANVGPLGLT